jgi:hypothetical protein
MHWQCVRRCAESALACLEVSERAAAPGPAEWAAFLTPRGKEIHKVNVSVGHYAEAHPPNQI